MKNILLYDTRQRAIWVLKQLNTITSYDDDNHNLQIALQTGHFKPHEMWLLKKHLIPVEMDDFAILNIQPFFKLIKAIISNSYVPPKLLSWLFKKFALIFDFPETSLKKIPVHLQNQAFQKYLKIAMHRPIRSHFFKLPAKTYLSLLKEPPAVNQANLNKMMYILYAGLLQTHRHTDDTLFETIIKLPLCIQYMSIHEFVSLFSRFLTLKNLNSDHLYVIWSFLETFQLTELQKIWLNHSNIKELNVMQTMYSVDLPQIFLNRHVPKELFKKIK